MANEAAIIELGPLWGNPKRFTVAVDSVTLSKGTIVRLIDPDTISGGGITTSQPIAGIVAHDRVPGESLFVTCYTAGKFDITSSTDVITAGQLVALSGANLIRVAVAGDLISGGVVGRARETSSASEIIAVDLLPGLGGA